MEAPPKLSSASHPCHSPWQCWLNSLATPGGNMLVLVFLLILFIPTMIFLMVTFGPGAPVVITLVTITSGFAAALTTLMKPDGARHGNERSTDTPAKAKP
jgi:hypothetical protein